MDSYTENLDDFGYRELQEGIRLLQAMIDHKLPDDFSGDGVKLAFNTYSGDVFLTNDEYEVCVVTDDGNLTMWYYTPYAGHEGTLEDLIDDYDDNPNDWDEEDIEYLRDLGADI